MFAIINKMRKKVKIKGKGRKRKSFNQMDRAW